VKTLQIGKTSPECLINTIPRGCNQPFPAKRVHTAMRAPGVSQAEPMTVSSMSVVVAVFMVVGVALFYMPGQGQPLQQ
jgi:hypothetical protein